MRSLVLLFIVLNASACSKDDESKAASGGTTGSGGATTTGGTTSSGGSAGKDAGQDAGKDAGEDAGGGTAGISACPSFGNGQKLGTIARAEITEASGIAESRRNPQVMWVNNDSGDTARLFAVGKDGKDLGAFAFSGATAIDWEDIAIGPGPTKDEPYLYAGDIGDNLALRANVKVYRVLEPKIDPNAPAADATLSNVETFTLTYPDGAHNAETLFIDPKSGDLYIVTKVGAGTSKVFRAAAPLSSSAAISLTEVAKLEFGKAPLEGGMATTGGDISFSGDAVLIRTYSSAFLWRRAEGASVAEALAGKPCPVTLESEPQGEAIGFTASGNYLTVSEGNHQPIWSFQKN